LRILIVDTYYPGFLDAHYGARPGLAREPYERQLASLLEQSFGTGDAYSRGLRAQGHEAAEVVANCMPLQLRWAKEHGLAPVLRRVAARGRGRPAQRTWERLAPQLVIEQAAAMDADLVYVQNTSLLEPSAVRDLQRAGHRVVAQLSSPSPPLERLRPYELIFSSFPHYVERFTREGIETEYLRLAFDEAVLDRLRASGVDPDAAAPRPHAVSFVGGFNLALHVRGTEIIEELCADVDVDVWGYGAPGLPPASPVLRHHHGEAWGLDMYRALAGSRTTVNRHGEVAEDYANNMRLFEATGVGAVLVTDAKRNLSDMFAVGEEVLAYRTVDDLLAIVRELERDEDRRRAIAAAGQTRTLRDHTYAARTAEISRTLQKRVACGS
jgi:hypothetical protein